VAQHLQRDLNAEHNSSDIKTRNEIQLTVRTTRWPNTCAEISTPNTATASVKYSTR
jgi:hypothetical protein